MDIPQLPPRFFGKLRLADVAGGSTGHPSHLGGLRHPTGHAGPSVPWMLAMNISLLFI